MTEDERNDAICKILVFGMIEVSSLALTESITSLLQTLGLPKNITDALVYPMTALMGGIVASVILGIMQKAKSDAKKEKLELYLHKNQKARARLLAALLDQPEQDYDFLIHKLNLTRSVVRALEEQKVLALESEQVYRNPVIYQQKRKKDHKQIPQLFHPAGCILPGSLVCQFFDL